MTIQGLNNTMSLLKQTEGSVDAFGGSTINEEPTYRNIKCRVSNPNRGDAGRLEQLEGIDFTRVVKVVVWPSADFAIEPNDIVTIDTGKFTEKRFMVLDVKQDSLLPTSKRAHIELLCERFDKARTNQ